MIDWSDDNPSWGNHVTYADNGSWVNAEQPEADR